MDPNNIEEVKFLRIIDVFDNKWGIWDVIVTDCYGREYRGTIQGDGWDYNAGTFEQSDEDFP